MTTYSEQYIWNHVYDKTNHSVFSGEKTNTAADTEYSEQEILNEIYDSTNHCLK